MEQEYLDPLLIEKIRDGENQAFRLVWNHLQGRLATLAYQYLHHYEDAEDAVAYGYSQLFEHRREMESISHMEGFLHTTVRNFCIDALRKNGRRQELLDIWLRWTGRSDKAGRETEADHKVIFAELTYCIQSTIERMPQRYQEAYRLYILENKTAKEVGKLLGVSDQTVREDVSRVLEQINTELLKRGLHITLMIWVLKMLS